MKGDFISQAHGHLFETVVACCLVDFPNIHDERSPFGDAKILVKNGIAIGKALGLDRSVNSDGVSYEGPRIALGVKLFEEGLSRFLNDEGDVIDLDLMRMAKSIDEFHV